MFAIVYALMTSKPKECYNYLFQNFNDFSAEPDLDEWNPQFLSTAFEKAAINSRQELPGAAILIKKGFPAFITNSMA